MGNSIANKQLKYIAEINFSLVNKSSDGFDSVKWITASNLLQNNVIESFDNGILAIADEKIRINANDIVIRRISPSYVNFVNEIEDNCFAFNNLIIVRVKENVCACYLAYYLNTYIDKLIKKAAKGTVIPTLGRTDLDEFEVALPSMKEQKALGKAWYLSLEQRKNIQRLHELEDLKMKYLLKKYIRESGDR